MAENSDTSLAAMREDYQNQPLRKNDLNNDPFQQFHDWFAEAKQAGIREPNAMTLATIGLDHIPTTRTVLLKDLDDRGFTFFTNYKSRKGLEIEAQAAASLLFLWKEVTRQVTIRGHVEVVSREESKTYFQSRPYDSRIGAWASEQSAQISNREWLVDRDATLREKYPDTGAADCVPIPDHWGGYRVLPSSLEFWQGGPGRLHDRFEFTLNAQNRWEIVRLSP